MSKSGSEDKIANSSKSHFFPTPLIKGVNRSFNSIIPKYFANNSVGVFSSQSSQRNDLMGSDSFSTQTPVKIRVRGRQEYVQKEGYIEISNQEALVIQIIK